MPRDIQMSVTTDSVYILEQNLQVVVLVLDIQVLDDNTDIYTHIITGTVLHISPVNALCPNFSGKVAARNNQLKTATHS